MIWFYKKSSICRSGAFMVTVLFFFLLFLSGKAFAGPRDEITVSAAMSLKDVFEEIGEMFELNHRNVKVYLNFGGSGALRRQIQGGAPVDVFAAASACDMDELSAKGLIVGESRRSFTGNSIVLVVPADSELRIGSFHDLLKGGVKRVAIGNPGTVSAGRYSREVLKYLRLWNMLKDRIIFTENVRQVMDYVARGEVDAGMVYVTDTRMRPEAVKVIAGAPEGSYGPVVYPVAVVKGARNEKLAREFIALVWSDSGRNILSKYGFRPLSRGDKK